MKSDELLVDKVETSKLLEIYKNCLTPKQYNVLDMYVNQDISISEISEIENVSRQAIFDMIKKTKNNLYDLENKIGVKEKQEDNLKTIDKIQKELNILKIQNIKIDNLLQKLR